MIKSLFIILASILLGFQVESQTWTLPKQDADPLASRSFEIIFNEDTKDIQFSESSFDSLTLYHKHKRYTTSIYELDTIALITTIDSTQIEFRALMCDGRDLTIDDPYKGPIENSLLNTKMLRLGYWKNEESTRNELLKIISEINSYIPTKKACSEKTNLKPYRCYSPLVSINHKGIYDQGITMPIINSSNSSKERSKYVQEEIVKCLGTDYSEEHLFKIKFTVDETGNVVNSSSRDCPREIKGTVFSCLESTEWTSGKFDGKEVPVSLNVLIGLNMEDKYKALEEKSKLPPENKQPKVEINLDDMFSRNEKVEEEVFVVVEKMPELIDKEYFEKLTEKAKKYYKTEKLNIVVQYIVEKDGSISNPIVLRSDYPNKKAWLIDNLYPVKYTPGKQRGRKVRVKVTQAIRSK